VRGRGLGVPAYAMLPAMPDFADFAAAAAITAPDSPLGWEDAATSELYRDLATAKIATLDVAPDFELPEFDCRTGVLEPTGRAVRLSGLRGRPVALVFGSYT
jgi:hypothetical protein